MEFSNLQFVRRSRICSVFLIANQQPKTESMAPWIEILLTYCPREAETRTATNTSLNIIILLLYRNIAFKKSLPCTCP